MSILLKFKNKKEFTVILFAFLVMLSARTNCIILNNAKYKHNAKQKKKFCAHSKML